MLDAYEIPDEDYAQGTPVSWVFNGLGDFLENYLDAVEVYIVDPSSGVMTAAATLFIFLYGFGVMYGHIETSARRFSQDIAKVFLVLLVFHQWHDTIQPWVSNLLFNEPAYLANGISEQLTTMSGNIAADYSAMGVLDAIVNNAFLFLFLALDNWEWRQGATYFGVLEALFLVIVVLYMVIYAVYLLVKSFLFMTIMLSLAPVFIPFALFNATRNFTVAWWTNLTSYMFVPLFTLLMLIFINALSANQYAALATSVDGENLADGANVIGVIVISLIGGYSVREVPEIARAVGSGFTFNGVSGLASGAVGGYRSMSGAVKERYNKFRNSRNTAGNS